MLRFVSGLLVLSAFLLHAPAQAQEICRKIAELANQGELEDFFVPPDTSSRRVKALNVFRDDERKWQSGWDYQDDDDFWIVDLDDDGKLDYLARLARGSARVHDIVLHVRGREPVSLP